MVTFNYLMFKERPVMSGVHQVLVLEPVWFNIFASNMDNGIKRKFADDIKLCVEIDTLEERNDIQRGLDRLQSYIQRVTVNGSMSKWKPGNENASKQIC
ncbi:rna-directed dna polymerase from mobile element jockey-like [Willisornis vidua]|uniref:Rna-directed dna polymerase from mobile element jockey-like n=1 Tax=Willisornis vidua TaxID=1566151 RepID=A0ABQ9CY87_9PASS|nr:rna-directed dna polymerase from mobile element jockey-like [Willisornis vidua]